MINVLFVCTGNSFRSQMAEVWLRALAAGRYGANSAGVDPHGQNTRAIGVMAEAGVDISAQTSKLLTDRHLQWADRVVTVCGHADETCPMLPPGTRKEHWPIEDPARAESGEQAILAVFRTTRDEIRRRVADLVERLDAESRGGTSA